MNPQDRNYLDEAEESDKNPEAWAELQQLAETATETVHLVPKMQGGMQHEAYSYPFPPPFPGQGEGRALSVMLEEEVEEARGHYSLVDVGEGLPKPYRVVKSCIAAGDDAVVDCYWWEGNVFLG